MLSPTKEYEDKVKEAFKKEYDELCKTSPNQDFINCKKNVEESRNEFFKGSILEYLKKEQHLYYGLYNNEPIYILKKNAEDETYLSISGNPVILMVGQGYGYGFLINKNNNTIEKTDNVENIIKIGNTYYFATQVSSVLAGKYVYTKSWERLGVLIEEKFYNNYIYVVDAKKYGDENVAIKKYDSNGKLVSTTEKFKAVNSLSSVYTSGTLYVLVKDSNDTLFLYGVDSKEKVEIAKNVESLFDCELTDSGRNVLIKYNSKVYTYNTETKQLTSN